MNSFFRKLHPSIAIYLALTLVGCSFRSHEAQRFRITNTSDIPIEQAIVTFPNERLVFGPLAPHSTSPYHVVQHGVYRDASYELTIHNQMLQFPVIDWVGEQPLAGQGFTSYLAVDLQAAQYRQIQASIRASED